MDYFQNLLFEQLNTERWQRLEKEAEKARRAQEAKTKRNSQK